jgi:hypothetical protein
MQIEQVTVLYVKAYGTTVDGILATRAEVVSAGWPDPVEIRCGVGTFQRLISSLLTGGQLFAGGDGTPRFAGIPLRFDAELGPEVAWLVLAERTDALPRERQQALDTGSDT